MDVPGLLWWLQETVARARAENAAGMEVLGELMLRLGADADWPGEPELDRSRQCDDCGAV